VERKTAHYIMSIASGYVRLVIPRGRLARQTKIYLTTDQLGFDSLTSPWGNKALIKEANMRENLQASIDVVLRLQRATLTKAEICLRLLESKPSLSDEVQAILIQSVAESTKEIDRIIQAVETLNERKEIFGEQGLEKTFTYED
jgi:hypothetical protein